LLSLLSKNKMDIQTVKITRGMTSNVGKSGAYNVFTSTKSTAIVRIKENEEKEFKVVKGNQKFWISQYSRKSNVVHINVQDAIVALEVGCDEDKNLWIREKGKSSNWNVNIYSDKN